MVIVVLWQEDVIISGAQSLKQFIIGVCTAFCNYTTTYNIVPSYVMAKKF